MSLSIPQKLIEQLKKDNVVLFCGAGISTSKGGLPSGGQLAQELAERAERPEMANAPLPEMAQAHELEMGHHDLIEYIVGRIDDPHYVPLRTHQLIAALPFTKIVTTNWDNLLEKAMDQADKFFVKVVDDSEVAYADEAKVLLVKLHGSIEQKDSIIITGDDYYDVFARLPEIANLVRTYFATKTTLFLGFGLADEDFKRLYGGVVRRIGVHKRRAYAVQLDPDELTTKYWEEKNVQIIAADATVFSEALADALGKDIVPAAPPSEPTPSVARQPRRVDAALPGQAIDNIQKCHELVEAERWREAADCFKNILRQDISNKEARLGFRRAWHGEEAALDFQAVIRFTQNQLDDAYELLTGVVEHEQEYNFQIKGSQEMLQRVGLHRKLRNKRKELQEAKHKEDWPSAVRLLQEIIKLDPEDEQAKTELKEATGRL